MVTLRPYQEEAVEAIEKEWGSGNKRTLLVMATGCHEPGQGILMADGKVKKATNIQAGDKLMGDDGTARTVLVMHRGIAPLYKITPIKGKAFVVTKDHVLTLVHTVTGATTEITVSDYMSASNNFKHLYKLYRSGLIHEFAGVQDRDLPVHPYLLGILIGDGHLVNGTSVTTMDQEIVDTLYHFSKQYNYSIREEHCVQTGKAKTYHFRCGYSKENLHKRLRKLGLYGTKSTCKFIPEEYKTAPSEQRTQLLAGILDTDGHLSGNCVYDYISASSRLANDVAFVARSLGFSANITECVKSNQEGYESNYWRVCISGDATILPMKVAHKLSSERLQKKNVLRTGIESVQFMGIGDYVGFTVDGNNRYLMDDFTVTHNCGKTIVFAETTRRRVQKGEKVLILAHRGELLEQAADKLKMTTGLDSGLEKAQSTAVDSELPVVVGSVQTMQRDNRLEQYAPDAFGTIIVDEAHHAVTDGYQKVLGHFPDAKVLGTTATSDRTDMRNLGLFFDSLAYEYNLPRAIREGYLSPIKALTVPLQIDIRQLSLTGGDYNPEEIDTALDPYLEQIADEMAYTCRDRHTVVFLPLIKTSVKFRDLLIQRGMSAVEVNGESPDRKEILADFENGKYQVICNSMLLTEGWDCPCVDCVVMLRPTKSRSLFCQVAGRGTRLYPGKEYLLLLDFLWLTQKHELCRPASLVCKHDDTANVMTRNLAKETEAVDILDAEARAEKDVVAEREEALARQLEAMRRRKRQFVDPLQFEMSINSEDLVNYVPSFGWEMAPASDKQKKALEKFGIWAEDVDNAGKASVILDRLQKRKTEGLSTPKQIRCLERYGFRHVGTWRMTEAQYVIKRLAMNNWRIPTDLGDPATYKQRKEYKYESYAW